MDIKQIEQKWNEQLIESAIAMPEHGRQKFFLAPAFPYPNSPQHIGHGRTYTTTDIYARYKRLKGYNVLFPMAFHVTGTPIIAMAKRVAEKDQEVLEIFKNIYGIPEDKFNDLGEPEKLVLYFSKEIELGMREMGYGIDWTRKFYSFDPHFNKFIEWHFKKLFDRGYIIKGTHPVPWCPSCNNAIGAHDTRGDKDPEMEEVTFLLFPIKGKDFSIAVATYRPETIFGVTNIWAREDADYIIIKLNGQKVVVSSESFQNIKMQNEVEMVGKISGKDLLSESAVNPIDDSVVPILKASFIDLSFGTGIVMSVPAHAPFDYLALRDLGFPHGITPKVIISIEGYVVPAKEVCERMGVKDQNDPKAEEATSEVYKLELAVGKMSGVGLGYDGVPVEQARQKVKEDLRKKGFYYPLHIIANHPVYCRCGTLAGVRIVKDQWFIDYGNKEWKQTTKDWLNKMSILPPESRKLYLDTIDWLEKKACTREHGLGTRFPFDRTKMIEALSDSTIYMAFYTIANRIKSFKPEELTEKFFDYVFYGKGEPLNQTHKEMHDEFNYWYPLDSRHSGSDLVRNHLPFFVFNHIAVFPEKHWPRQIVTNGFVLMDGKKMSKSMGNILPLRKAIAKYGADLVRFAIVYGADLSSDTDFNEKAIDGIRTRLLFFESLIEFVKDTKSFDTSQKAIDNWLYHVANKALFDAEEYYKTLEIRKLSQIIFYDLFNYLKWYSVRRGKLNTSAVRYVMERFVQLIYPFMPHIACEWYAILWQQTSSSNVIRALESRGIPVVEPGLINHSLERLEQVVMSVLDDIEHILKILKKGKPDNKITLIVADEWKRKLIELVKENKNPKDAMSKASSVPEISAHKAELFKLIQKLVQEVGGYPEVLPSAQEEEAILNDAAEFLSNKFSCSVVIELESRSKNPKAKSAMPLKPAILIE